MRPSPAGRQRRSRVGGRLTQYPERRARRTPATPGRQAATVVVATKRGDRALSRVEGSGRREQAR